MTGGEKSNLPLNQGLTVWRSDEGTSVRWSTINERTWPETTSCASISSAPGEAGRSSLGKNIRAKSASAVTGTATYIQRHTVFRLVPASARNAERRRFCKCFGGRKDRSFPLIADLSASWLSYACLHA